MLEGSWETSATEVKTGRASTSDLKGLGEFARRHSRFRPLVVRDDEGVRVADRAGFEATPEADFLLRGPPR